MIGPLSKCSIHRQCARTASATVLALAVFGSAELAFADGLTASRDTFTSHRAL